MAFYQLEGISTISKKVERSKTSAVADARSRQVSLPENV